MMAMLIGARGIIHKSFANFRNGSGHEFRGTETIGATYSGSSSENVLILRAFLLGFLNACWIALHYRKICVR